MMKWEVVMPLGVVMLQSMWETMQLIRGRIIPTIMREIEEKDLIFNNHTYAEKYYAQI
jgi:hypothetical protein